MNDFDYKYRDLPPHERRMAEEAELACRREQEKERVKMQKYGEIYNILHDDNWDASDSVNWWDRLYITSLALIAIGSAYQFLVGSVIFIVWIFSEFRMGAWPILGVPLVFIGYILLWVELAISKKRDSRKYYLKSKYSIWNGFVPFTSFLLCINGFFFMIVMWSRGVKGAVLDMYFPYFPVWEMVAWIMFAGGMCVTAYAMEWSDKVEKYGKMYYRYGDKDRTSGNSQDLW